MKFARIAAAALLFISTAAMAAPASEATIKELLSVMKSEKLIDSMRGQMDALVDTSAQRALQGKAPNAKQRQAIANLQKNMSALMQKEFTWAKFEPMTIRLYQETFSEDEVNGMLQFYKTPAGQAVIDKMPTLMHKTMLEVQKMTGEMAPDIEKIERDFQREMQAAGNK